MLITLESLRVALGDKLGCVLTPELAASIEFLAQDRAEHAHDPAGFEPREREGLVFRVESFRDILAELIPLHEAHYSETEQHLLGIPMRPDYDYMAERERTGSLLQFTARDGAGELVGNLRMYIGRSLHTGQRFAEEDTFYLKPEQRRGHAAMSFLRYAEESLVRTLGIREIRASTKTVNTSGKLLQHRGYRHVANQYVKIFREE